MNYGIKERKKFKEHKNTKHEIKKKKKKDSLQGSIPAPKIDGSEREVNSLNRSAKHDCLVQLPFISPIQYIALSLSHSLFKQLCIFIAKWLCQNMHIHDLTRLSTTLIQMAVNRHAKTFCASGRVITVLYRNIKQTSRSQRKKHENFRLASLAFH